MEVDPDYAFDISQGSVEEEDSRLLEENSKCKCHQYVLAIFGLNFLIGTCLCVVLLIK